MSFSSRNKTIFLQQWLSVEGFCEVTAIPDVDPAIPANCLCSVVGTLIRSQQMYYGGGFYLGLSKCGLRIKFISTCCRPVHKHFNVGNQERWLAAELGGVEPSLAAELRGVERAD